jgi:hypothetical protein
MLISKIQKISPENENIKKVMLFDEKLSDKEKSFLNDEFNVTKEMIEKSMAIYRNVALVVDLKTNGEGSTNWKVFLEKKFPQKEEFSKLDNVFIGKDFDTILLLTNRRLMMVDIKKTNEKLEMINAEVEIFNKNLKPKIDEDRLTLFGKLKTLFS